MIPVLENAVLGTDLDCQDLDILNPGEFNPVPDGLVGIDDPSLNDPRVPPAGSVTDDSVNAVAGIVQSKLELNGVVPPAWLGTGASQAAQGSLAEFIANKDAPGGYASLDSEGKLPSSVVTPGAQPGTVNSISVVMPQEFSVTGGSGPIVGLGVTWINVPARSWLGADSDSSRPFFNSTLPTDLIPSLDASIFTTGKVSLERLPGTIAMGTGHAGGMVPAPGSSGDPENYLGRDMQWHSFQADLSYQPTVPNVNIISGGTGSVTVLEPLKDSVLFYRINGGAFIEVQPVSTSDIHATFPVNNGDFIEAYASKAGYNNSSMASYTVVTISSGT